MSVTFKRYHLEKNKIQQNKKTDDIDTDIWSMAVLFVQTNGYQ